MADALNFRAIGEDICQATSAGGIWTARRGFFEYTIVTHPGFGGFEIAITCKAPYLPTGPFETLEDAISACNRLLLR